MTFLVTVGLIVFGAALLIVGIVNEAFWAFIGSAAASAVAVVLLWKAVGRTRDRTFITDPPVSAGPEWDKLFRGDFDDSEDETLSQPARDQLPEVSIAHYEDLVASEIMPSLETLSVEELEAVVAREQRGLGRPIIISRAEKLIDLTRGGTAPQLDLREEDAGIQQSPGRRRGGRELSNDTEQPASAKQAATRKAKPKRPSKSDDLSLE